MPITGTGTTDEAEPGRSTCSATTWSPPRSARWTASRPTSPARPAAAGDFNDAMIGNLPYVFAFVLVGGVPAAAGHVPLDRDPDQGDRAQPAVRRRRLRSAGLVFQHGWARAARLRRTADRLLAAAVPVRDPVRALDGLPRVHPDPDPRGLRPRHEDRGRGRTRDQEHRRRRHQRRDRDGRGVLDVRDSRRAADSSRWASASRSPS